MPKEFQQKKIKMMHHLRQHHHRRCVTHPVTAANNIGMDEGNGSGTGMEMLQSKDLSLLEDI